MRWLDRYWAVPHALGVGLSVGGLVGAGVGPPRLHGLLWHGTFTINSLTHMFGSPRYATTDNSRNSALLAAITLGEGWHNNHHYYQRSTRQGFFWWEFDPTYYILRLFAALGLVWDLHEPPAEVVAGEREVPGGVLAPCAAPTCAAEKRSDRFPTERLMPRRRPAVPENVDPEEAPTMQDLPVLPEDDEDDFVSESRRDWALHVLAELDE